MLFWRGDFRKSMVLWLIMVKYLMPLNLLYLPPYRFWLLLAMAVTYKHPDLFTLLDYFGLDNTDYLSILKQWPMMDLCGFRCIKVNLPERNWLFIKRNIHKYSFLMYTSTTTACQSFLEIEEWDLSHTPLLPFAINFLFVCRASYFSPLTVGEHSLPCLFHM